MAVRDIYQRIERPIAGAGLRLMRPWERLAVPVQVGIAFPVLTVLLFLFHLGPLNQPPIRALFYGVFWSVVATPALVLATQNELRKRERKDDAAEPAE